MTEDETKDTEFYVSTSNKSMRRIRTAKTKNSPVLMGISETAIENFTLTLLKNEREISISAKMVLDIMVMKLLDSDAPADGLVEFKLSEYMDIRQIKDPKTARKQVLSAFNEIACIKFDCTEINKLTKAPECFGNVYLFGGTGAITRGTIRFRFNPDYLKLRELTMFFIDYPAEIFKLNLSNQAPAYYFGMYISENYRMNENKKRASTISIKTLLENCPSLPSRDEVASRDRHYYKKIILPTLENLDALNWLSYGFYPKGNYDETDRIADPRQAFSGAEGNAGFFASVIRVDYSNFPKHTKRLEQKTAHLSKENSKK